jgi:hypothetical protein
MPEYMLISKIFRNNVAMFYSGHLMFVKFSQSAVLVRENKVTVCSRMR